VTHRLPLFPLATVLYPGLLLPLHIFEELRARPGGSG
jgi:Lon protease-like protein